MTMIAWAVTVTASHTQKHVGHPVVRAATERDAALITAERFFPGHLRLRAAARLAHTYYIYRNGAGSRIGSLRVEPWDPDK